MIIPVKNRMDEYDREIADRWLSPDKNEDLPAYQRVYGSTYYAIAAKVSTVRRLTVTASRRAGLPKTRQQMTNASFNS